jgi:DNA-binding transcriptional LysR family regulator
MNQVENIRVFLRVAELLSFTRAAQSLGLPKASVSTAVIDLEAGLGVRLLHRTTRRVELTQDGRVFWERARDVVSDLDELTSQFELATSPLRGRIRVDMGTGLARDVVVPRLPEFLAEHPEVEVELGGTERMVDLAQEGLDFTVRAGGRTDSGLVTRPLGSYTIVNCVSREYAERHGAPRSLDELRFHSLVHYVSALGSARDGFDYVDAGSGEVHTVAMSGRLVVSSAGAYVAAVLAGLGLVQIPRVGVREYLDRGELIEVLPSHRAPELPVYLAYLNRRHQPRRVRVFMDWVAGLVREYLAEPR